MENKILQCRSTATNYNMGLNFYSTFGAQENLSNVKLNISPHVEHTLHIPQQTNTTGIIKRTFYNEQLSSSFNIMNWDMETNYLCPSVVHHNPSNNYVHLTECVLETTPPSTAVTQNEQTHKLNNDDEIQQDGIVNPTQQQTINTVGTTKQNFTDLNGSKVIRLVRAKQATKRKSSLDTLIEVVQKELLRVNGQTNSTSPSSSPPHYSQTRSITSATSLKPQQQQQQRPMISSVLPSSHPNSLTSQSFHSFKTARKRPNQHLNNSKQIATDRHRCKSFSNNNNDELTDEMDFIDDDNDINNNNNNNNNNDDSQELDNSTNNDQSSSDNIDEIVRDTVDKLVAITLLNNAPFIVNMITGTPPNNESKSITNSTNTNNTSNTKPSTTSDYYRDDLALLSSTASELQNSMQQTSPVKQQIILQPTTSTIKPSTLFVTPRILNFQTVVPKPTANVQIGNTKIILVSPSQTSSSSSSSTQTIVNNSPVKVVKLTPTLPKNVQIVIPSRTTNESLSTTTIRPLSTLTTCSIDQIPQAAQEVTITTSPNLNKPRRRSSSTTPTDKPVGKILRPIAKVLPVYSSNNSTNSSTTTSTRDEITKPMTVNFQQRSALTHGPIIYRMTSVNPNIPIFRVRTTNPSNNSTIKTETKPISVTTTNSMCYDTQQTHTATATGGSVSVLACFKTTKKRNKERAIMPRPSTMDSIETTNDIQQRLNPTGTPNTPISNMPLIINNQNSTDDLANSNSSIYSLSDYHQQSTRLIQQHNLSTTYSDKKSSNNISIYRNNSIQLNPIQTVTNSLYSPLQTIKSTSNSRPLMEDKCIQCIDDNENSTKHIIKNNSSKKRNQQSQDDNSSIDDSWTVTADTLLRNVLSQYGFRFLDVNCQQNLSAKFDTIQANLVSGLISSKDEFYRLVIDVKETLLQNGLSKISADNLEKLYNYFEVEYPKLCDNDSINRTNERKRTRRQ